MKRASVLRATCAVVAMSWVGWGCSDGSNPSVPPGLTTTDGGASDRRIIVPVDQGVQPSEAGGGVDAGSRKDSSGDLSSPDVSADVPSLGKVSVSITSPASVPTAGIDGGEVEVPVVKVGSRFAPEVRIEVQSQGGDPTLDSLLSVKATLVSKAGSSTATVSLNQTNYAVLPESDSRVYIYSETPMDLSKVAGGEYDLQVVATTVGGGTGVASQPVYIDAGPVVTFLQPPDGAYVKGSTIVSFLVSDANSTVATVEISIGQTRLDPSTVSSNGMQYTATIDFGSFNPPLDGNQLISVLATNLNGNTSLATRKFTVDNTGPAISGTKPATGDLIGKVITIEAKVTDPASVMDSSVTALVAHGDVRFEVTLVKGTDGVYRQLFDTTKLPSYALFPSISFRAQDILGNESSVGYLVSLDNTPPILDLDPPDGRIIYSKEGRCSHPFDPVGPDAIDDGSVVTQLFDIRARIEDDGNKPLTGELDYMPIATVDPATVKVLILDDTSLPLLVDSSSPPDGICDEVNPDLVPSSSPQSTKEAQLIDMVPLPANAGKPDFSPQAGVSCSGSDSPPDAFCDTTYSSLKNQHMTYVLSYSSNLPSIWTIAPIVSDKLQCAGRQYDAANNLSDGWACVAVQAADKVGNKQISRPLRICVAAQPGSTACAAATVGGADLASVTMPSASSVVVTTKGPVTGATPLAVGEKLVFGKVSPGMISFLNGAHKAVADDGTGTRFTLPELTGAVADLWQSCADGTAGSVKVDTQSFVRVGLVGFHLEDGAPLRIVGATPTGTEVILLTDKKAPTMGDPIWTVADVVSDSFALQGTKVTLSGFAAVSSKLPDCTGTLVVETPGQPAKVDPTKPCTPQASFPKNEVFYLR